MCFTWDTQETSDYIQIEAFYRVICTQSVLKHSIKALCTRCERKQQMHAILVDLHGALQVKSFKTPKYRTFGRLFCKRSVLWGFPALCKKIFQNALYSAYFTFLLKTLVLWCFPYDVKKIAPKRCFYGLFHVFHTNLWFRLFSKRFEKNSLKTSYLRSFLRYFCKYLNR